ncbi:MULTISPECIES: hypothetical protein [unclassified Carboxylicivirga]|uniref:hypothetical protein n=1 Tax=Carboxylicivirga TaxID=1628153 RepID=UPI003D358524
MIQDILTYSVVAWAVYHVIRFFFRLVKPGRGQSPCASGTCACSAKSDLFNAVKAGKYPTLLDK